MEPVWRRARKSASSRRKSISNYTNRVAAIARRTALHISSIINSPRRHGRKKGKKSFSDFLRVVVVVGQKKKNKSEVVWKGSLNACGSRELPLNVSKEEKKRRRDGDDGWLWPLATVSENTHPSSGCASDWSQIFKRAPGI